MDNTLNWFVYILECADKTLYTGICKNLPKRVQEHNESPLGAKYTRARRPVHLVYIEQAMGRSAASKREYELKKLTRLAKRRLIQVNYSESVSLSKCFGVCLNTL